MLSKKAVLEALPALNPGELYEIALWCEALGASTITPADDIFADHAFSELARCLSEFYKYPAPPSFRTFMRGNRRQEKAAFLEGVEHLKVCLNTWWPKAPRNVRLGLLHYLCRLAFDECCRKQRPNWKELSRSLCNLERVVDMAFPGWLRTGMFQERALNRVSSSAALHAA